MNLEERMKCYGNFAIEVRRNGETIRSIECSNTFTNGGYKLIYGGEGSLGTSYNTNILLGTGNVEITQDATSLTEQISNNAVTTITENRDDVIDGIPYTKYELTKNYSEGEVVGNISEIGVNFGNIFICGQLIRDGEGSPTTIPVTSGDQLFITYNIYIQQYQNVEVFSENIDGTEVTVTRYAQYRTRRTSNAAIRSDINPVYYYGINETTSGNTRPVETVTNYVNQIERNIGVTLSAGNEDTLLENIVFYDNQNYINPSSRFSYRIDFNPPLLKSKDDRFNINFNLITKWDD